MRIVTLIILVLTFLVGAVMASMLNVNINSRISKINYEEIAEMEKLVEQYKESGTDVSEIDDPAIKEALEQLENVPSKGRATTAGILGILLAIASLVMVVLAFMKKELVKNVSFGGIGLSILVWLITPVIEAGRLSGANTKTVALISVFALTTAAVCAIVSQRLHLKKSAEMQA